MQKLAKLAAIGAATGAILGYSSIANAVVENTDAVVTVIVPVAITENLDLQFGKVGRPTSGTNDVTISTADTRTLTGAGDASLVSGGTERAAEFTITATAGETLTIEASETSSVTGLSVDDFVGKYDGGSDIGIDPADSATVTAVASATLEVGATLAIDNTASAGVNTLAFDLTVNYQ